MSRQNSANGPTRVMAGGGSGLRFPGVPPHRRPPGRPAAVVVAAGGWLPRSAVARRTGRLPPGAEAPRQDRDELVQATGAMVPWLPSTKGVQGVANSTY